MKLVISEKQLNELVTQLNLNKEIIEQGEGDGAPEAGTSSDGEQKTGASKWESGVTRGPANQIGVTKWADSYKITRGRANPLSEQVLLGPTINPADINNINNALNPNTDTPTKEYQTFWGDMYKIPTDGSVRVSLWTDEKPRGLYFKSAFEEDGRVFWPYTYLDPSTKKTYVKNELAPGEDFLKQSFPTGTIKTIYVVNEKKHFTVTLTRKSGGSWQVNNSYFYNDGKKYEKYDPEKYIHISFTTTAINWLGDNWPLVAEVVLSIIAGLMTGGSSFFVQAAIQAGVGLAFAGGTYYFSDREYDKKVGLAVGVAIAFIPYVSAFANKYKLGPVYDTLASYTDDFAKATTKEEVELIFKKVGEEAPEALDLLKAAFKEIPKQEFEAAIKNKIVTGFAESVKSGKIDLNQLNGYRLKWWKETLLEGGLALPVGITTGFAYRSLTEEQADRELIRKFLGVEELEQSSSKYDDERKASIDSAIIANKNKKELTIKNIEQPTIPTSSDTTSVPDEFRIPRNKN
jgi:hypothetical protein